MPAPGCDDRIEPDAIIDHAEYDLVRAKRDRDPRSAPISCVRSVKRAYLELESEGVIVTRQGRGSFVSETVDLGKSLRNQMLDDHLAAAAEIGRELGFTPGELEARLRALRTREQG